MSVIIEVNDGRNVTLISAKKKVFKTGSHGYHASAKVILFGRKYQCSFILVELGSKPK